MRRPDLIKISSARATHGVSSAVELQAKTGDAKRRPLIELN